MSSSRTQTIQRAAAGRSAGASATTVVSESNTYAPASLDVSRGKGFPTMYPSNPKMKQYTWEEVAQHNTGPSTDNTLERKRVGEPSAEKSGDRPCRRADSET
jgi:hypothetical protein